MNPHNEQTSLIQGRIPKPHPKKAGGVVGEETR
jgi:hypothetical protein